VAQPEITFLIINYNTIDLLRDCLISIKAQTAVLHHILVIDNHSNDGSPEMVVAEFPTVQLIANQQNTGFPKAVNQGLAVINTSYIFVLNSDIFFSEDTALVLKNYMDTHPQVGIAGTAQIQPDGIPMLTVYDDPTLWAEFKRNILLADVWRYRIRKKHHIQGTQSETAVDWLMGSALFMRTTVVKSMGGMDETVFMYGEEYDLCYRIRQAGWQVHFVPTTQLIHHENASGSQLFKTHRYSFVTKSSYYFQAKHKGYFQMLLFICLQIIGSLLRIFLAIVFYTLGYKSYWAEIEEHGYTLKMSVSPTTYRWLKETRHASH
jgi:GT2 family glycosyltransferase